MSDRSCSSGPRLRPTDPCLSFYRFVLMCWAKTQTIIFIFLRPVYSLATFLRNEKLSSRVFLVFMVVFVTTVQKFQDEIYQAAKQFLWAPGLGKTLNSRNYTRFHAGNSILMCEIEIWFKVPFARTTTYSFSTSATIIQSSLSLWDVTKI